MQKSNLGNIRLTVEELIEFMEACSDEDRELILKRIHEARERQDNYYQDMREVNLN